MTEDYRVQLDVFSGPLDLLLYLIRRDEVDIEDVRVAPIAEQYLEYVHMLEQLDPNTAGEFLALAATLIELKSRALLPTPPIESIEDDDDDPRSQLVRQLLEYKRFKDAARALGTAADDRAQRFVRKPADLPEELRGVELEEVEVWDLLGAFNRVMAAIGARPTAHEVRFDETPQEVYAAVIVEMVTTAGTKRFDQLFDGRSDRAEIVGLFLALLELIRKQRIRAEQDKPLGTIYLFALEEVADAPISDERPLDNPSPADDSPPSQPVEMEAEDLAAPGSPELGAIDPDAVDHAAPRVAPETNGVAYDPKEFEHEQSE